MYIFIVFLSIVCFALSILRSQYKFSNRLNNVTCLFIVLLLISLIWYSGLVVTTSFHGVVFCILFHKRFVYFSLSGTYAKGNSRVLNLLSNLSLSDCIWKAPGDFKRIYHLSIDWDRVEELLAPLRDKSVSFLKQVLS